MPLTSVHYCRHLARVGISRYIAKFGERDTTLAMEGALSGEEHSSISLCVFFAHAHITLRLSFETMGINCF